MPIDNFRSAFLPVALCASLLACGEDAPTRSPSAASLPDAVPLTLDSVIPRPDGTYLAALSSADGDSLSLPINLCQADIIAATLAGAVFPRPMTHDLLVTMADSLELSVTHVLLDLTEEGDPGADLLLGSDKSLPCSTGDALAIAQRTSAPLLGTRSLLYRYSPAASVFPAQKPPSIRLMPSSHRSRKAARRFQTPSAFVDMRVLGLVQLFASTAVILIDADSRVAFPIYIDFCQAGAILMGLENEDHPVLVTHDLLRRLLQLGQSRVTRVAVTDLIDNLFIGQIDLAAFRRTLTIDARPSDALALAVLTEAPIQVPQNLLALVGEDPAPYLDLFAEKKIR